MTEPTFVRCTQCNGLFRPINVNAQTGRCWVCIRADERKADAEQSVEIERLKNEIAELKKKVKS